MHPQLQAAIEQFDAARERLHRLAATVPADGWAQRPSPENWSPAECVAHLNLTSLAYVPQLQDGLRQARGIGGGAPTRFKHGFMGWLLTRMVAPGKGGKVKTAAAFVPTATAPMAELVAEFDRLQDEQVALVRAADGLPIDRVRLASPFNARIKYTMYAAFTILPNHQHRHLLQAERAWAAVSGQRG
ncbi:DinB family protein [Longimicrobium sp.]|uniref:DinB family protein n=1 Tax=Longimicrobium sp. TaxID=2029185 RepID=UPI002E35595B|nr:DinB family protein [Longimicrobium sp.]HEX6039284.1 DinB family protein [Longimicrobium sp.]